MKYNDLLKTALKAAEEAAKITEKYFGKLKEIGHKPGAGLVTIADKEAESKIINIIKSRFPDHQIYAEESGEEKTASNIRWIIDPLDGTTNYAHSVDVYCVSIGVEVEGELVVGVIHAPKFKEKYVGVKGAGATLNGKPIHVSKIDSISESLLATGFSYEKDRRIIDLEMHRLGAVLKKSRAVRRLGSAAIDMAYVACGRYDGFWEVGLSAWDVAAGAVIVKEAGGIMTNLSGEKFDPFGSELIASNGLIHDALKSALKI